MWYYLWLTPEKLACRGKRLINRCMTTEFVIKQFSGNEVNELISLIHSTIIKCYPLCYAPEVISFFLEYHSSEELLRKAREGIILMSYKNDKLIATGYLVESELGGVYVHPGYQKKGVGRQMVQKLLEIAGKKKLTSVWLDSTPFAVELYKQFGFTVIEEKVMFVDGNVPLDYYYMKKELL